MSFSELNLDHARASFQATWADRNDYTALSCNVADDAHTQQYAVDNDAIVVPSPFGAKAAQGLVMVVRALRTSQPTDGAADQH